MPRKRPNGPRPTPFISLVLHDPQREKRPRRQRPYAVWLVALLIASAVVVVIGLATAGRTSPERRQTAPHHRARSPLPLAVRAAGSLPAALQDPSSAMLSGGAITLLGGLDAGGSSQTAIIRLSNGRTTPLGSLPTPLHDAAAVSLGPSVYLFGGGESVSESGIYRLDPGTGKVTQAGRLPEPRSDLGAATVDGTAYLVGGFTGQAPLATILAFKPGASTRVAGHLPQPLRYAAVTAVGGRIVIAGGMAPNGPSRQVLAFDPATGRTSAIGSLPEPLSHAAAATLGGYVYVIGGRDAAGSPVQTITVVDPRTGMSGSAGVLRQPVSDEAAVGLGSAIMVMGGRDAGGATARVLELTPRTGARATASLRPGSDPSVLPGDLLIADKANNRLLLVSPTGRIVWSFPRRGELRRGQTFLVPDDAFFTHDGRDVVATEEDDFVISEVDVHRGRIVYRYGHPGISGSGPGYVYNPDDAIPLRSGAIVAADIKNCRLIELRPPLHRLVKQVGVTGGCYHAPPASFASPNGAFPLADGGTVVTEIGGVWVDVFNRAGRLTSEINPPGFTYPSDTNQVRPGVYLSVDYADPGTILEFDAHGHVLWRFSPRGPDALNHPSLALPLPNGDVVANDDYNDRVIVVDPRTNQIVWQYGHTGVSGTKPGYLNIPDGVDLAPPYALSDRFPNSKGLPGG
jgi:outer membrane protein assembly factor BamB